MIIKSVKGILRLSAVLMMTSFASHANEGIFHGLCDMPELFPTAPLTIVTPATFNEWLDHQSLLTKERVKDSQFKGADNSFFNVYTSDGNLKEVAYGMSDKDNFWIFASLAAQLPQDRVYTIDEKEFTIPQMTRACLAWTLEHYRFNRYRTTTTKKESNALLVWPKSAIREWVKSHYDATALIRDLVNTPACDMGPYQLVEAAINVATKYDAKYTVIGDLELVEKNYPMIYAVGKGATQSPRLFDMNWQGPDPSFGPHKLPKKSLVLVGKGVTYDTGGLSLKPTDSMKEMKRDMGGAAHVLALAQMIMEAKLPVNLRLLIPAVENSISANAYRPGDVLTSRKGLTVEIGNTDAEGRLILADALTEGSSTSPDLIIDCATLTGAARIAVGPLVQPFFTNSEEISNQLMKSSKQEQEAMWPLPLFQGYKAELKSDIADLNNVSSGAHNGAINAALFLEHFVKEGTPWIHVDMVAWNKTSTPGKPAGGEATGLRTLFNYISGSFLEK